MIFIKLITFSTVLVSFIVIILGAYVRLNHAGLGCPDWPGCYGRMAVTQIQEQDTTRFTRNFIADQAGKEMLHRYLAGTLGVLIFLQGLILTFRRKTHRVGLILPWFLVALVILQALLGMWTVTLKLHPLIVLTHLLGGFFTFTFCGLIFARTMNVISVSKHRKLINLTLMAVILQIILGGWMSANYAALACGDLPTCQGVWWPAMDFISGFDFHLVTGPDYEFGLLELSARTAIHMAHRLGALVVLCLGAWLGLSLLQENKKLGLLLLALLITQTVLGLSNVYFSLPLWVAVAHNGVASLILFYLLWLKQLMTTDPR